VILSELVTYLQYYLIEYAEDSNRIPRKLMKEVDGQSKSKNGEELIEFLNNFCF